jgi:hypothetical protein
MPPSRLNRAGDDVAIRLCAGATVRTSKFSKRRWWRTSDCRWLMRGAGRLWEVEGGRGRLRERANNLLRIASPFMPSLFYPPSRSPCPANTIATSPTPTPTTTTTSLPRSPYSLATATTRHTIDAMSLPPWRPYNGRVRAILHGVAYQARK